MLNEIVILLPERFWNGMAKFEFFFAEQGDLATESNSSFRYFA